MSGNNIMSNFKWAWLTRDSWGTQLQNYIESNLSNRTENLSHEEICWILDKFSEAKDAPDFGLVRQIYGLIGDNRSLGNYFVRSIYILYKNRKNKKDDLNKLVNDSDFKPILTGYFGVFMDFKSDDSWTGITYAHQIDDFIKRKGFKYDSNDKYGENSVEDENFVLNQKDVDWVFKFLESKKAGFNFDLISTATNFIKDHSLKIDFLKRVFEHNQKCAYFDDYEKCLDNTLRLFTELVLDFGKQDINIDLEEQKNKINDLFGALELYKQTIDFKFVKFSMTKLDNNIELKKYLAQKICTHGQNIGFKNEIEDWGDFLNLLVTEDLGFEFGGLLKLAYDHYVVRNGSTFAEFMKKAAMSQIVDLNDYVSILSDARKYNMNIDFDLLEMMLDKQNTEQEKTDLVNYTLRQIHNGEVKFENKLFDKILDLNFKFDINLLFDVMLESGYIKQIADLTNFIKKAGATIKFDDINQLVKFYKIVFNNSRAIKNAFWDPFNLFGNVVSLRLELFSLKSNVRSMDFARISGKDLKSAYQNTIKVFGIKTEDFKINVNFVLDQLENDDLLNSCFSKIKLPESMNEERVKKLKSIFVFSIKNIVIKILRNRLSDLNNEHDYNSFVNNLSVMLETVKSFCLDMQDKKIKTTESLMINLKNILSRFDKLLLFNHTNQDIFIKSCCDLFESENLLSLLDSSLKLPDLTENEQKFYIDRVKSIIRFFVGKIRTIEGDMCTSSDNGESLLSELLSCNSINNILRTIVFPRVFSFNDVPDQKQLQLQEAIKNISSVTWKTFSGFLEKNLLQKKNTTVKQFAKKLVEDTVPLRTKLVKLIYTLKKTDYDLNNVVDQIKDIVGEFEKEGGLLEKYDFRTEYKEFIVNITKSILLVGQNQAKSLWRRAGFWLFNKWVFSENSFNKFGQYISNENNKMPISNFLSSIGNEDIISAYVKVVGLINKCYGTKYDYHKTINIILAVIIMPFYLVVFCPACLLYNAFKDKNIDEGKEERNGDNVPTLENLEQNNEIQNGR